MGLEKISNLNELNQLLNDTAAVGYDNTITASSWGSRDFTLTSSKGGDPIHAKMDEIVSRFEQLAQIDNDPNRHLIGDIHDKIFELNMEGEKRLNQEGVTAVLLRDIKTLFSRFQSQSHAKKNDYIELKYINTGKNINAAREILTKFDSFNREMEKLKASQKNEIVNSDWFDSDKGRLANDIDSRKMDYSKRLIRDLFADSKNKNPENRENTKNALRYLVHNNPEKALDIIGHLKINLKDMSTSPGNPKEFMQTIQHFFDMQEEEIYSSSKLHRPPLEEKVYFELTDPTPSVNADNPIANLKAELGEDFSIILDEHTKKPTVQFKFKSEEQRKSILYDLETASEFSLYEKSKDSRLLSVRTGQNDMQTLSPYETMLLSGVDEEHFLRSMYQEAWNRNNAPKTKEEQSKILNGVTTNLTDSEIKDFILKNNIPLSSIDTPKLKLEEEQQLKNAVKNFSEYGDSLTTSVFDYINDKSKVIPVEEKLLFFIEHANLEAMDQLLASIKTKKDEKALNTPIRISTNVTATPLEIAREKGRKEIFEALLKAGAIECIMTTKEPPQTIKHSIEYLKNKPWESK